MAGLLQAHVIDPRFHALELVRHVDCMVGNTVPERRAERSKARTKGRAMIIGVFQFFPVPARSVRGALAFFLLRQRVI